MAQKIYTPKVIADPVYGIFDIRPMLPMVETEEFQSLGEKKQLGLAHFIFPSATHTRKAHSLGAYNATRELANLWLGLGLINGSQAKALSAYALYHDIGHPAFSHVTEELCAKDNDEMSADLIQKLSKQIEATGADPEAVLKLARHEDSLYLAVHDKNIGMEKLDYLERDGLNTILSRPSGIDYLRKHIYFVDGELMIDEKVVDNAIEVQNFYLKMYKNVYLRKASVIAQRMLQKTVYHSILAGELSASDLGSLTDGELIGIVRASENPVAKTLYDHFKRRDLFREAITLRHKDFTDSYNPTGKSIAVVGLDTKDMERLIDSKLNPKNQKDLEALEQRIAELSGIPFEEILAVPVFNAWRFKSKDIKVYSERGTHLSLMERFPAHFKNLEEISKSYAAFRICTTEKYRDILSDRSLSKKILDLLFESAA